MPEKAPNGPCNSCVGACCREGILISLSEKEAATLEGAGTVLKEFLPAGETVDWANRRYRRQHAPDAPTFVRKRARSMLKPGDGLYGLDSDCGFLEETEDNKFVCGIHEDEDLKPVICSSFRAGSIACHDVRRTVITEMYEQDSLIPSLAGVALGEESFRDFEAA